MKIFPVILSGGSGTRLWPLSREHLPKQFLPLVGDKTMLQMTVDRLQGLPEIQPPIVICNEAHRFLVAEQLRQLDIEPTAIVLEPIGRNTAPAAAAAALVVEQQAGDNDLILILPADHVIDDVQRFQHSLKAGIEAASQGALVTFGIVPDAPETGYGYIKRAAGEGEIFPVEQFVEKPDQPTAQAYLDNGDYLWNSGMFLFSAASYLDEIKQFVPDMLAACEQALQTATQDMDFTRLDKAAFSQCPSDSIDYAVMEHTDKAVVVPMDAGWNDVGSWSALKDISLADTQGNVTLGDVLLEDTNNSYIRSTGRLVVAVGVDDHIVVETKDAVLVAHKDRVQDVKRVVEQLKALKRDESHLHAVVYRPWGSYEGIAMSDGYQVKHIMVNPGASLSLQMHHHRAEHWVVVRGTARVTRGDEVSMFSEDQSTYIPLGTVHRLENPGVIPLELIEVQTGSYLGEDDIVRFEDKYGR